MCRVEKYSNGHAVRRDIIARSNLGGEGPANRHLGLLFVEYMK
jgi:hypothetical protein